MKVSVIISTYNAEKHLEKVLLGFNEQINKDFEIVIADDGSGPATAQLIEELRPKFQIPIKHIWQEDKGFRKCLILNKAILVTSANYLIFTDGDCIPRNDFVATHLAHRKKGHFLSGGYFKLPNETSIAISKVDIARQNCFNIEWLKKHGLKSAKKLKITAKGSLAKMLNILTPTRATWNGHNASAWKTDIININGFNNEMAYGGEDREFGERLINNAIKPIQIRYSAICVHLDHPRVYETTSGWELNNNIRSGTRKQKVTSTSSGISQVTKELHITPVIKKGSNI